MTRQLTFRQQQHHLTNTGVWSWDGCWIYYDIRSDENGSVFDGSRIERAHMKTGEVEVVYQAPRGASVGVVTASPTENKIAFIHGPEEPTPDWSYCAYHRRGVSVCPGDESSMRNLDARDVVDPFTPGALRGGSHVHVFDAKGEWISFTYEDHVLATNLANGQLNQRNVGVSIPVQSVSVPKSHRRNHDGDCFSVLVTQTHDRPEIGTDQISKAYEDAWVGTKGYQRPDGTTQDKALAFIGDVLIRNEESGDQESSDGAGPESSKQQFKKVPELFIVDLPRDCTVAGAEPLQGTATTRPVPPAGTVQRRLTRTADRVFPGLATDVRHWPRSKPDGSEIVFLVRDDDGLIQLGAVSPNGGSLRQVTDGSESVASAFSIHPGGEFAACVMGNSVCEVNLNDGHVETVAKGDGLFRCLSFAVVYSPDGNKIAFGGAVEDGERSFNQIFLTDSKQTS
ncbi:DUF3748 domain-containing protein [Rhodopirellula bahusiensis]|uniref:DUF3748 domain-containing protein n=1 Tax=Rhodopirellula bahusiensis TaxID=2014065 RepID=UPI003266E411